MVRQRAFSERVNELMMKYTNQQLTSAQVIAELVAMAKEILAEGSRGPHFTPPVDDDQLAFYDAVAQNESAVTEQGEGVLAQIARDLVAVMQLDVRTDWTVREDVRARLRSPIKRLLVKPISAGQAAGRDQVGDGADGIHDAAVRTNKGREPIGLSRIALSQSFPHFLAAIADRSNREQSRVGSPPTALRRREGESPSANLRICLA